MTAVVREGEVLVAETENVPHFRIQRDRGQRQRNTRELLVRLLEMIGVEMRVTEGMNELAGLQITDLGDHHGEQRIGGDVEGNTQEDVGAALVKLAGKPALGHVELKHGVAGRQRHAVHLRDVPGTHDVAPRIGVGAKRLHDGGNLIDGASVRRRPGTPLRSVDGSQVALFVRPLVPDVHVVIGEVLDVGAALEKPEQLVDDQPEHHLLRRHQRKALAQIEAHLVTEDAVRSRPGAVVLEDARIAHLAHQIEILFHWLPLAARPEFGRARGPVITGPAVAIGASAGCWRSLVSPAFRPLHASGARTEAEYQ